MTPLVMITGIVLGSAAAIALGLSVVLLIFFLLGADEPRLTAEIGPLVTSIIVFSGLTAVAAVSFVTGLKGSRGRWAAQAAMWAAVAAVGWYYWP